MFKEQARPMPTKGEIYVHFKGNRYIIIDIAMHTETKELLVVYQALSDNKIYARPLVMFMSPVDKEKYPTAQQQYRFERTSDKANLIFSGTNQMWMDDKGGLHGVPKSKNNG